MTVEFKDSKAKIILANVRQRVATWSDTGRAISRASDAIQTADRLIGSGPGSMGAEFRPTGRRVLRLNEIAQEEPLWIIGDVRGDVLALETALGFIDEATGNGRAPQIFFLGDLTAGTLGDAACLAIALERFASAPTRTILIAGDREVTLGLSTGEAAHERQPRGLAQMPIQPAQDKALQNLTRAFSQLAVKLPVAVICPGAILLAHSGLPRASLLSSIQTAQELESREDILKSFVFDRLHARDARVESLAPVGGVTMGSQDFVDSMRALSRIYEMPLERMVRGQDTAPEGYRWFRHYGDGVLLTITTMADVLAIEAGGARRNPCVARLKSGRLRVVRLEIPEDLALTADQIFPRNVATRKTETSAPLSQHKTLEMKTSLNDISTLVLDFNQPRPTLGQNDARVIDAQAAQVHFERGVRLLAARAWPGARQAFQEAACAAADVNACLMNEAVACLSLGLSGHQDALRLCRMLIQSNATNPYAYFNMGVSYLTSERNPIEAGRAFRTVTQILPQFGDGWWALGLAFSLRADRRSAEDAFAKASECGSSLARPHSMEGIIPARELSSIFEALRGRAQYHPSLTAQLAPLAGA